MPAVGPEGCKRRAAMALARDSVVWLLLALSALVADPGMARSASALETYLNQLGPAEIVPGAERFGAPEGQPPLAPAIKGEQIVGYAYLTSDVVDTAGYSGKPIHIVVGVDPQGTIVGAKLVEQTPIIPRT